MHAVILCNGRKPPLELIEQELKRSDLFIAADGGANHAQQLGLTPQIITGDLDSYQPDGRESDSIEILRNPDQETNDLEKALHLAIERGATEVTVFGAIGRRLDQTLKNLSVLGRFHPRLDSIRFRDRYGDFFLLPRDYRCRTTVGTVFSLIPLSGRIKGVTTEGLEFPLRNEPLEMGVRDGTSNRAAEPEVRIRHKAGTLLLFIATSPREE